MEWDPGPPPAVATLFEQAPFAHYKSKPDRFRLEWGPVYYRGRLDGSAKLLIIGQDPSADENVARRILVGDAGQRVQGYLTKLGITRSYVMVNTFLYSITGQFNSEMKAFAGIAAVAQWRNSLLDALATNKVKAVLAFGNAAKYVIDSWPGATPFKNQGRIFCLMHPTAPAATKVLSDWNAKLSQIAANISPDPNGAQDLSPYSGSNFTATDLARIPLFDLPFGVPSWMGTGDMATRKSTGGNKAILWTALAEEA